MWVEVGLGVSDETLLVQVANVDGEFWLLILVDRLMLSVDSLARKITAIRQSPWFVSEILVPEDGDLIRSRRAEVLPLRIW